MRLLRLSTKYIDVQFRTQTPNTNQTLGATSAKPKEFVQPSIEYNKVNKNLRIESHLKEPMNYQQ